MGWQTLFILLRRSNLAVMCFSPTTTNSQASPTSLLRCCLDQKEILEIYAFMEAADESKRQGGAAVKVADVLAKARVEALKKIETLK